MLIKVYIKNFLSIKEEECIKVNKNVTSIIGKNESGKSTILKAINKLNGYEIKKNEKNVNLKSEPSYIKGVFKLTAQEIKEINNKYVSEDSFNFYELPTKYGDLYYTIEVTDEENTRFYELSYMYNNTLKRIDQSVFIKRITDKIKEVVNSIELSEQQKKFFKELYKMDQQKIREELKENIDKLELLDDIKIILKDIIEQIEKNKWIDLLPHNKFISFSSFNDILKDTILFSELEDNQQAKNVLKIANISVEELGAAFEKGEEQALEDMQAQYIEVVSKKFKEIFQQNDEEFKLKIRLGTGKNSIDFLTLDKTCGTSSIALSQRSDGFKWYLSLYLTLYDYLNNKNEDTNYILLLDEPNLYLHPGAQNNLLYNVFYKEFSDVQVLYTTHSPYMIDSNNSFSIRIVEKDKQTKVYNSSIEYATATKKIKDVDTLSPLLTALELNVSNSLTINEENIVITVEGIQDVYILTAMIKKCKYEDKFENVKFISGMSADKIPYMYSYLYGMGYNVFALVDNDRNGRNAIKSILSSDDSDERKEKLFKYNILEDTEENYLLEDLFSVCDKQKYLPGKSTVLYKRIFDEIDSLEFEKETIKKFKDFFEELLNRIANK